ncbi:transcriptional regulator of RNA polII, SAGA, subunit-domain-containing protein [Cladorrhinum samala]|uniref:Transcriptional regulator of RNA polII, SAGA, subunit-domain-containing protein n=1 Tax=Cladorrhinum samala TaxID=585594 RepID=A0AAV9HWC0_9PEZI|nr:transcriptional regulator of RNA polII, SAGA, subunit-domain-containing protein [Cladorrhinum samala]
MVDIDPAALSRPSVSVSTPILQNKTINVSAPSLHKPVKTSQLIPARIDLEPIYTALKVSIGAEQWVVYKETITNFLIGRLNQAELSERIDPILGDAHKEHLHNQLIAAIYGNVTREMPDQGLAPWVSANDKPSTTAGNKPVSGDAAERRLKGEVMQLPARDRRRIKDIVQNDFDPYDSLSSIFSEQIRIKQPKTADVPASAAGGPELGTMNFDLEIRKRYAQPLAVESGEFPDVKSVEARMRPFCFENGLTAGHEPNAAQFMSLATETFLKQVMSSIFSRTRSNGPGDSGNSGFGPGGAWIQTHKYKKQLAREEEAFQRGEISRDKTGLLPVESKAASDRGPLSISDLRLALEMGDCGMGNFPTIVKAVVNDYREGELQDWDDYTYLDGRETAARKDEDDDVVMGGVGAAITVSNPPPAGAGAAGTGAAGTGAGTGAVAVVGAGAGAAGQKQEPLTNGINHVHPDQMDIDNVITWEGADPNDGDFLNGVLDSCLAVG